MWWPLLCPSAGDALVLEDLERNLMALEDLVSGGVGEHFWADGAISRGRVEARAYGRLYKLVEVVSADLNLGCPTDEASVSSGDPVTIPSNGEWCPICSLDFSTVSGGVEINITLQVCDTKVASSVKGGIQLAISVDGAILSETVTGSGDRSGDVNGDGYGGSGVVMPVLLRAAPVLTPGAHTVQAVGRTCRDKRSTPVPTEDRSWIGTRTMFVEAQ